MAHATSPADYAKTIELMRSEKDHWFRTDPHAPLPASLRPAFRGLDYFPPDPAYRVRARLVRYPAAEPIVLATSTGVPRRMIKYGGLEFDVAGVRARLDAYKAAPAPGHHHEDRSLFVPFRDATSGKESYGAARYLDIQEDPSDDVVLDFNLAYNPYCAYSEDYVCPLPPRENWLAIPIRAGEKTFVGSP
ncbi:MAG: DUF1684 domain-containing protein [Methanobacteriota archaeon]